MDNMRMKSPESDWNRLLDECTSESTIERYHILRDPRSQQPIVLGTGGFGQVIKAADRHDSNRIVAIKQIEKKVIHKRKHEKFVLSEIKIHSQLDHRGIVKLYDAFHDDEYVYIVTAYCAGGDLVQYLQSRKTVSPSYAASVIFQLADAVNYLRSEKKDQYGRVLKRAMIHRDLKPSNILLDSDQRTVKIADFGLATEISEPDQRHRTYCGTPGAMAPEVVMGKPYSKEVDEYGLGCILYSMLVGQLPTTSDGRAVFESFRKNVTKFRVDIPDSISSDAADLIEKLLCPSARNRLNLNDIRFHPFIQRFFPNKPSIVSQDSGCGSGFKNSLPSRRHASHSPGSRSRRERSDSSRSPLRQIARTARPVQEDVQCHKDMGSGWRSSRPSDRLNPSSISNKINDFATDGSYLRERLQVVPPFKRCENVLSRTALSSRVPVASPMEENASRPLGQHRLDNSAEQTETKIVRDAKGDCLRDKTTPLQALRLKPYRAATDKCVVHILQNGDVCLEQLSSREKDVVTLVLLISPDGLEVVVYEPRSDDGKTGVPLSESGPAILTVSNLRQRTERYKFDELPVDYWKSYRYASCMVDIISGQTPKVIFKNDDSSYILMENGDFEAKLADGRIVKKMRSKPSQSDEFVVQNKNVVSPARLSRLEEETLEKFLGYLLHLEKHGAQLQLPDIFPMRCGMGSKSRK